MRSAAGLAVVGLLSVILGYGVCNAQMKDPFLEDGRLAKAFCQSPAFKQTSCGWVTKQEEAATLANQCVSCGTAYMDAYDTLPSTLETSASMYQIGQKVVSLACKGRVVTRSVFKFTQQPAVTKEDAQRSGWAGTDCTYSRLFEVPSPGTPVVRCELQLPSSGGSEVDRALKAKEVKCWKCDGCGRGGGCPAKTGVWYSDSATFTTQGCNFDASKGYAANTVGIVINPKTSVLLAKFEVCNSPNCFNAAYEDAKLANARPCVKGKCV
eukprot:gene6222-6459_t